MKLAPYPEYKDSGVAWLDAIPIHWDITQLGRICRTFKTGPFGSILHQSDFVSHGIPIVNPIHMIAGRIKPNPHRTISLDTFERLQEYGLAKDDIVFSRRGELGRCALVTSKEHGYLLGTGSIRVRLREATVDSTYLLASYQAPWVGEFLSSLSVGATMESLNTGILKQLPTLIPPTEEQTQIARFLDWKSAQINKFIRNKRRLIELLKEQKQNVINEAVTRGLNPKVKLKPSGVEWIGDIPEHWENRYFFQSFREKQLKNDGLAETNRLSLSYGKIIRKCIDATEGLLPHSFETYQIVKQGDIILRLTDLQNDHKSLRVGFVEERGIITSAYLCLYSLPKIIPEFAYLLLHAYDLRKVFYGMGGGVRQSIGFSELKRLPFPVPPESEQAEIVKLIQQETKVIDGTIARAQREIELMREYRTRLISDVVTGQVDVRGIEAPEVAEEELLALDEDAAESDDVMDDAGDMDDTE